MSSEDLSGFSMLDLFRQETETNAQILTDGLLALERDPTAKIQLESCMRAAHSLKGAARIVDLPAAVDVAHAMEDVFVAAQHGQLTLQPRQIDHLLSGVDLLSRIARTSEAEVGEWKSARRSEIDAFLASISSESAGQTSQAGSESGTSNQNQTTSAATELESSKETTGRPSQSPTRAASAQSDTEGGDRVLRVTAENLNRLLGLAGEALVESRWLKPFAQSLLRLKRQNYDLVKTLDWLRDSANQKHLDEQTQTILISAHQRVFEAHQALSERLVELELFDRRSTNLAQRLYDEALACRMRPFADGVKGFPRMVRDLANRLGKQVRFDIVGEGTQVDRDMLEKLEAPLNHLLRNSLDHGIESPEERITAGKSAEGIIRLEAHHSAGALQVIVSDDGRGFDVERLRRTVVARKLTNDETAQSMSESELLEFLFLPGFTLKETVTEISGRGVGLDVVQSMVKQVRGTIRVSGQFGKGARFLLQLPLTLSVVRTLLVEIGGEPYAFPLAYIVRTLKLARSKIELLEGRQHFLFDGQPIGLVTSHQVFDTPAANSADEELSIVVVGGTGRTYGLVVDRFLGEHELVVQPLDSRLGKIKDISSGALMADGSPVLIVDVEDLINTVGKLVSAGRLNKVGQASAGESKKRKRVLVVDDSLTVRELERKLLGQRGYEVEAAVDGMDGWNAVRTGHFDLMVTDVDMPRMDGIELVKLIKKDQRLKSLPVMIVSYKDRDEDRQRGLEVGADYYLTKGSFHDETLVQAVVDLIGEPGV